MEFDQMIKQLTAAKDDGRALKLATVDIVLSTQQPELRKALEAAAIPHWFDAKILGQLLQIESDKAKQWFQQLQTLPFVESFKFRDGFNVHEATRLALRKQMFQDDPDQMQKFSAKAVEIFIGNDPVNQVEKIYHQLIYLPEKGADELEQLWKQWNAAGRYEQLYALANILKELLDAEQLQIPTRARTLICYNWIRRTTLSSAEFEKNAHTALQLFVEISHLPGQVDAYDQLGDVFVVIGKLTKAISACLQANKIILQLIEADPDNTGWLRDLSISYNKIGRVQQAQGKLTDAMLAYQEYNKIMLQLTEVDPDNTGWLRDLSVSYNKIGSVQQAQVKLTDAMLTYQEYNKIMLQLTEVDPDNTGWLRELSVSYNKIDSVQQAQGKLAGAMSAYQEDNKIMLQLTEADPDNTDWLRELSVSYNNIGSVQQAQSKLAEALSAYQEDKKIMLQLTEADPDNMGWLRELSVSYNNIGALQQKQGKLAEAKKTIQAAHKIQLRLTALDPTNFEWQKDLENSISWLEFLENKNGNE